MPVEWKTAHIPLAAGMQQKADPRAMEAPALEVCINAEFDEVGGIQKRKPFEAIAGTAPTDIRRLAVYDGELIAFTATKIYSYSDANDSWIERADYLAPTVAESAVFTRIAEQTECDTAQLGGVTWYAWKESGDIYISALDASTGAVLLAPAAVSGGERRPRLLALTNKVLLFFQLANGGAGGHDLKAVALDPTDPATVGSSTNVVLSGADYDVCQLDGTTAVVAMSDDAGASYTVATVTEAVSVVTSSKARTSAGPIAIAADTDSGSGTEPILVVRAATTNVRADPLNGDLSDRGTQDLAVGSVTGTTITHITACRTSYTAGSPGLNVFDVYWSHDETELNTPGFWTRRNTVTVYDDSTAHVVGTAADFIRRVGIASRAFSRNNRSYVWLTFAGESAAAGMAQPVGFRAQLQNTCFLYDQGGTLIAKAAPAYGGGFQTSGHLPNVQSLGSDRWSWCGTQRRIVPLAERQSGYSARAPLGITLTLDDDDARRFVRLGATLYVAGGQVLQFDGTNLVEVGFHVYPWYHEVAFTTASGDAEAVPSPGNTYAYLRSWRYDNAKGERERSTTATTGTGLAVQGSVTTGGFDILEVLPLHTTLKSGISAEIWRSEKNPVPSSPLYLVTSQDPDTSGTNGFVQNDPAADDLGTYRDDLGDADLRTGEPWPESPGVLETLAPPAATILTVSQDRLFLAGIAGQPHRVAYSRLRGDQEIAGFNDGLYVDLPPDGGSITAMAFLNETLVVLKERAIYMLPGDGFDNAGGGANYGPARLVALDVGAQVAEGVAVTPEGILFRSAKGWYLLNRGWQLEYVGGAVSDYDDDTLVGIEVLESQHQVRIVSTARILVRDTLVQQWSEWNVSGAVGSVMWGGRHVVATSTSVLRQRTDHTGADYSLDIETAWIKTDGLQGFQRARRAQLLGEDRGVEDLRVRVARDYSMSGGEPAWIDDKIHQPGSASGAPLQMSHRLSRQKCQAAKFRFTDGEPYSIELDGDSEQMIVVSNDASIALTNKATWECWFNPTANWLPQYLFQRLADGYAVSIPAYRMAIWGMGSSPYLQATLATSPSTTQNATSGTGLAISVGTWSHIAFVYDGAAAVADRMKIYLDGVSLSLSIGTLPTSIATSTIPLGIGGHVTAAGDANPNISGQLFDVRIWNVARTASQIADNRSLLLPSGTSGLVLNAYRGRRHDDVSGNGNTLTPDYPSNSTAPSFVQEAPYEPIRGEGLKLTGLALEYGIKGGPRRLPATQRQ